MRAPRSVNRAECKGPQRGRRYNRSAQRLHDRCPPTLSRQHSPLSTSPLASSTFCRRADAYSSEKVPLHLASASASYFAGSTFCDAFSKRERSGTRTQAHRPVQPSQHRPASHQGLAVKGKALHQLDCPLRVLGPFKHNPGLATQLVRLLRHHIHNGTKLGEHGPHARLQICRARRCKSLKTGPTHQGALLNRPLTLPRAHHRL